MPTTVEGNYTWRGSFPGGASYVAITSCHASADTQGAIPCSVDYYHNGWTRSDGHQFLIGNSPNGTSISVTGPNGGSAVGTLTPNGLRIEQRTPWGERGTSLARLCAVGPSTTAPGLGQAPAPTGGVAQVSE